MTKEFMALMFSTNQYIRFPLESNLTFITDKIGGLPGEDVKTSVPCCKKSIHYKFNSSLHISAERVLGY